LGGGGHETDQGRGSPIGRKPFGGGTNFRSDPFGVRERTEVERARKRKETIKAGFYQGLVKKQGKKKKKTPARSR